MNFVTILLGIVLVVLLVLEGVKLFRTIRDLRRKKVDPEPVQVGADEASEAEKSNKEVAK